MSTALPTHEVVAVFPAEIKAGMVRLPVRMRGERQCLVFSTTLARLLVVAISEAGIEPTPATPTTQDGLIDFRRPVGNERRDYWRRMRLARAEWDARTGPRGGPRIRLLAEKHRLPYGSVQAAFSRIRNGSAPFPEEEPGAPRPPVSKPNGKLL